MISSKLTSQIHQSDEYFKSSIVELNNFLEERWITIETEFSKTDEIEFESQEDYEVYQDEKGMRARIHEDMKRTIFCSLLFSCYSKFESNLMSLIAELEENLPKRIKSRDLRKDGSHIDLIIKFLDKVYEVDVRKIDLSFFRGLNKSRNILIHNNGKIPIDYNGRNKLIDFVDKNEGIVLIEDCLVIEDYIFLENTRTELSQIIMCIISMINEVFIDLESSSG